MNQSNKKKGDILEEIVAKLCSDYDNAKTKKNVTIKGKTDINRQIDVLIEATYGAFDIKIIVEAKNYSRKVDIDIVESLRTKLIDVGGSLGVIVCPLGFTEGAKQSAAQNDIQLFQAFDHKLANTSQLIPLRYIVPSIQSYQLTIAHTASGGVSGISLPTDVSKWRITIKDEVFDKRRLMIYAWNNDMFPKQKGRQVADFGVVKIGSSDEPKKFYYLELKAIVIVKNDYYLKLFPASFMKNINSGKGNHQLFIDAYSKPEDMTKNGWKHFVDEKEMEKYATPFDTSPDMRALRITEGYTIPE